MFLNITEDNIDAQHLCCAIADKKHQCGVAAKKRWLRDRLAEGHVFRKLDDRGKVFIEYAPLETAWVPAEGEGYLYIYCLWVSGAFKGKGYGKELLDACISDAKARGRVGVCVLSAKKKKPYLSEKAFLQKHGFVVADSIGEYELLALSFNGTMPTFAQRAKAQSISDDTLTIYYGLQCPLIPDCVGQVERFCAEHGIAVRLIPVDSLEKAKDVPCVFNNWAVFYRGRFESVQLLNEGALKKLLGL